MTEYCYFEVSFWGFVSLVGPKRVILRADVSETIGTAINRILPDESLTVRGIAAARSLDGERASLDRVTPVAVMQQFLYKYIFVEISEPELDDTQDKAAVQDAFGVLMAAQKAYNHLPVERPVNNSKDRLYNQVLQFLKRNDVGFTPLQVETTGKLVIKTLTDTLWYLDPHWEKFTARSISCPEFKSLRGFFDWKSQKMKEPNITVTDLDDRISRIVSMTSCGVFLTEKFTKFNNMCDSLTNAMVKYSDFLKKQAARTTANREQTQPVRSLDDRNVFRDVLHCETNEIDKQYALVCESLKLLNDFEPLFLFDYEPVDVYERKIWLKQLKLPFPCRMYSHNFGNYMGMYTFLWKSPTDTEDRAAGDLDAVTTIKNELPTFSTRAMRRSFINKYAKSGAKPAVLRHIYRYLTEDASAPESQQEMWIKECLNSCFSLILQVCFMTLDATMVDPKTLD